MKKNFTLGGIRTRDLSFTTLNSNREVTGLNPSEGNSMNIWFDYLWDAKMHLGWYMARPPQ